jgi:hypothetical protein
MASRKVTPVTALDLTDPLRKRHDFFLARI